MRLAPRPGQRRSRPVLLSALAGGALLAGCSDSTDPTLGGGGRGITTAVTVQSVAAPVYSASPEGVAILSCDVSLSAKVNGNGVASWSGATFKFYPANDLRVAFDSVAFPTADIANSWGGVSLSPGVVQGARWNFAATIPFTIRLDYRYRPAGATADSTASAQFTCQPTIPANAQPPTVTGLNLQPASGTIQPGETLSVSFTAAAPAGLWQTVVAVRGACDTTVFIPGRLAQSTSYATRITVPRGCVLGSQIGVTVAILDAGVRAATGGLVGPTVVDHTPPQVSVDSLAGTRALSGDYFVGDSIPFQLGAADNDVLAYASWEVQPAGLRDSVLLGVPGNSPIFALSVRAGWVPSVQLSFTATDRAGNLSAAVSINTDSLRLYPDNPRPTAWRAVAGDTRDARVDSKRGVFYLLFGNEHRLMTLRLSDASLVATLDLPCYVTSFDFAASGDSLIMACPLRNALGVLDLTAPVAQVTFLPLTATDSVHGQYPAAVLTSANGKAFIGLEGPASAQYQLLEVDLGTGAETVRLDAGSAGGETALSTRSPGHDLLIVGAGNGLIQLYHATTNQFGPLTQAPPYGGVIGVSADGQVIADGLFILDAGLQLVRKVRSTFGGGVPPSFLAPDGQSLYYVVSKGLIRTRVSDGAVLDRTRLPIFAYNIRVSDDGQWAVYFGLSGSQSGQVGVIDLR